MARAYLLLVLLIGVLLTGYGGFCSDKSNESEDSESGSSGATVVISNHYSQSEVIVDVYNNTGYTQDFGLHPAASPVVDFGQIGAYQSKSKILTASDIANGEKCILRSNQGLWTGQVYFGKIYQFTVNTAGGENLQ